MNQRERLVIVGGGMAGGKLIEEILARDTQRYQITVIGEEPYGNYTRIKLVVKLKEPDLPDFFLNTPEWYHANGVEAILGYMAVRIDRTSKNVELSDGKTVPYDKMVLATGSRPFIPPMSGLDLPGVFTLRKLEDIARVKDFLEDKSQVTVVGGGILGLELALMLRLLGKKITISHLMPTLMEMQLPEEAGRYLQKHLEDLGIKIILGTYITHLLGSTAGVEEARFKDGTFVKADAVFFNCGIRPNIDLARECGLTHNKGVAVNEQLQTSDPDIYACGECLEFKGETWGLVAPVYEQAQTLAAILCGENAVYAPAAATPARLKSDIPVISMGRFIPREGDEITLFTDPACGIYKQLVLRDNMVRGAVLVGEDLNSDVISLHYSAKIPAPARRADLLFPGAKAGDTIIDGKQIPDETLICECNGISAGKIRKAIHGGCDTLYKVMNRTRAGTGCGNCKNKIKSLLISEVGELRIDPAETYYVPGVPMERPTLEAFILENNLRSVSQVFAAIPGSVGDGKTRMGLDFLLNYVWKGNYEVEPDSRCANDRFSGNIQCDGRYSVIPDIPGGVADSRQLRAIADAADKYQALIKITGADRIGLYSLQKKDLHNVWSELQMGSGHAFTKCFRACKSCVGSSHCRFGLGDSLGLAQRMGERYRGTIGPGKFKMGVSGCPRNCAEATIKDFGVIAIEEGWELFIGGNGGAHVTVAKSIARVKNEDEVVKICDRFYEFYRRHAKYGERSAPFLDRVGFQPVVDAILNAPASDLRQLEEDFQESLDSYSDPWHASSSSLDNEFTADESSLRDGYHRVADISDIPPGTSRLIRVHDTPVAVFHGRDHTWVTANGVCPHKQGPMVDGIYGNGRITCPLHSYAFDIKTGECDNPEISPLEIYPHQISDGHLYVIID